ncbi:XrtA/PEP-CTERM system histidine kinase PrsK [Paremcibacter congregatus]|uniref:XrtA/PEP-CTERM system histidine kinase PrsK n=1 Tax=Paremcibacter congregatus TaxID=2043170 RepID=UPI003A9213F9
MEKEFGDIGFITFVLSGGAYFLLSLYLVVRKQNTGDNLWLNVAILVSALWSLVTALTFSGVLVLSLFLPILETLRGIAWIFFFAALLTRMWHMQGNPELGRKLYRYLFTGLGVIFTLNMVELGADFGILGFEYPSDLKVYSILILCIIIFLLVENLYRNSSVGSRWGIRLLLLSVGSLYIYDFLLFADTLLFSAIGVKLYEARGLVNFIIVPLLALSVSRNPTWKMNIGFSRKVVFHTVTLIGTGAYLIGMASAGYFLQNYGGKWGNLLQATFILIALVGLVIFITSGRFRAITQVFLTKHFFKYRYDYREEWLKFIKTMSDTGEHYNLRERSIKSLADVMDSPGGALWLCDQPDVYQLAAKWNFPYDEEGELSSKDTFIDFLARKEWVIDLNEQAENGKVAQHDIALPEWIAANSRYWLVLPLVHLGKLIGFVVLLQPRVKSSLNWESTDLVKTIGRQVASYLAEQVSEMALAETREFDSFNRKFAFVVHDIKNLTSQLSLMVKNAEKHATNPEFQKDMVLTVQDSVAKMNSLLSRITIVQEPAKEKTDDSLDLCQLIGDIVGRYNNGVLAVNFDGYDCDLDVLADAETVETVMMHLIENAREACAEEDMKIGVQLSREGEFAIIKVSDNGHGMDQDFIKNELFRPFRSTKKNGYGIGAYESREMIKSLGGRLNVSSTPGEGTTMKVYLRMALDNNELVL